MRASRPWLALLLAVALATLAGCGGKSTDTQSAQPAPQPGPAAPAPAPKAPVKIILWHAMNTEQGLQGKTLVEIIQKFNSSQQDIVVEQVYQGSYGDLDQKLQAALAANSGPTLSQMTDDLMAKLLQARTLVDLNRFVRDPRLGFREDELKDVPAIFLQANTVGGQLAAWPFARSTQVVIYDRKLVPNPPRTWDEFREAAKAATKMGADGKPERYGFAFKPTIDWMDLFMGGYGLAWLTPDGTRAAFDSPEHVQLLEDLVAMAKAGYALQMQPNTYESNIFNEGRVAMVATTSASLSFIHQGSDGKRDWAVAPLPAGGKGNKTPFFGNQIGIFANAKPEEQAAAWQFIKYLTNPENTALWAVRTGYVPVRFSAMKTRIWEEGVQKDPGVAVAASQLDRGSFQPIMTEWYQIRRDLSTAVETAVQGKGTPREALEAAAKKANDLLAKRKN